MSESEKSASTRKFSILRFVIRLVIGLIVLLVAFSFLLLLVGGTGPFDFIITLAFGWIVFLTRTVPRMTLNADLLGMGILCIVLILLLAHQFLGWISASIAATRKVTWKWQWKWTWCGLSAALLLFFAGMAMGGMAHQIGWIASSSEPWFEFKGKSAFRNRMKMQEIELAFRMAMDDSNNNLEGLRRAMWSDKYGINKKAFQDFHFLLIMEETKVAGFLIFPRNPQQRAQLGAMYSSGEKHEYISSEDLPIWLRLHQAQLVAF